MFTSFGYLGMDLAAVAALYFASSFFGHAAIPAAIRWGLLWPAYWILQGAVCTGLWVIAHECGHQVRFLGHIIPIYDLDHANL
jgi:omega-6 fatty acid desaturase (delta-12 desaturase)